MVIVKKDIEDTINKYFPKNWRKSNSKYFLNSSKYVIDNNAIRKNLNNPIRDFVLRGGKRLRPVLFLTCIDFFGKDYKKYLNFAVFIELIHNGTLIFDDIEDDGVLRRGSPTCHMKFGLDTAVNAGFGLHVMPLRILLDDHKELTAEQRLRLWQIYAEEMMNVSFGQCLDIHWHKNPSSRITINNYLEMVRLKTGSLMRMSLRMACVLTGQDEKTECLFKDFAENIGMAFQIKDDALDLADCSNKFGKIYGNDISEGKMSLPVVYALRDSDSKKRRKLLSILRKHTRSKKLIKEAVNIVQESGSIDKSIKFAEGLIVEAWDKIEKRYKDGEKMENLKGLTYYLVTREY